MKKTKRKPREWLVALWPKNPRWGYGLNQAAEAKEEVGRYPHAKLVRVREVLPPQKRKGAKR